MSESTQWDMEGEAKSMLQTLGIVRLDQKISSFPVVSENVWRWRRFDAALRYSGAG